MFIATYIYIYSYLYLNSPGLWPTACQIRYAGLLSSPPPPYPPPSGAWAAFQPASSSR